MSGASPPEYDNLRYVWRPRPAGCALRTRISQGHKPATILAYKQSQAWRCAQEKVRAAPRPVMV